MQITVARKFIAGAKRKDSHQCMIADSIRDRLDVKFILVDLQSIRWSDMESRERYFYLTPPVAQKAILDFDNGSRVKPFTFKLSKPFRIAKVRARWTGRPEVVKAARARYAKRKRSGRPAPEVKRVRASRERTFGVRLLQG